jgi:hypothetical protein
MQQIPQATATASNSTVDLALHTVIVLQLRGVAPDSCCFCYRDHDVEGMTDGFDAGTAYGVIEGFEDPSMGWSR